MHRKTSSPYFLVFSDDFGEHPSSCQHLFRCLPKEWTALWVNTVGMRYPKATGRDFKKAFSKSQRMLYELFHTKTPHAAYGNNLYVCQPPMLPLPHLHWVQTVNRLSVVHAVRKYLKTSGMESLIIVVTAPNASAYIPHFKAIRTVYYCTDDFTQWPGLEHGLVKSMEKELIQQSDILITTSNDLREKLSHYGKQPYLLTHGVNHELFSAAGKEHPLLREIPKPRVGYFGLFDDRNDIDLLERTARKMSHVSFVIVGPVETNVSPLRKLPNIFFLGNIPYEELPPMAKGWNICMLPYKRNRLTEAIQPLKIKEYLATGKPVISTPIAEACNLREYVHLAENEEQWSEGIQQLLPGLPAANLEKRRQFLAKESWQQKAKIFFRLCTESLDEYTNSPIRHD